VIYTKQPKLVFKFDVKLWRGIRSSIGAVSGKNDVKKPWAGLMREDGFEFAAGSIAHHDRASKLGRWCSRTPPSPQSSTAPNATP
jgi:hypothetical protein